MAPPELGYLDYEEMTPLLYILLGRAGDILSFIPLLWHDAQTGQKPALMVAKEYAPLLEGCSYITCVPFDGGMHEIDRAYSEGKAIAKEVRCVQTAGPPELVKKYCYEPAGHPSAITDCHEKELWMNAGRFDEWKQQYPLVFDRRNSEREEALIRQVVPKRRACILVATSGISSPFPYHDILLELLRLKFKYKYHVIDIGQVRADRLYDMLGLFERFFSYCLVASDSALLHLAYASRIPVVALVQDAPNLWYGSAWRKNHIAHIRYRDFPTRAVEMLNSIAAIGEPTSYFGNTSNGRKIVHVWNHYEVNGHNRERIADSRENWEKERTRGCWINTPVELGVFGQDSKTVLKDQHRFPLLKNAIGIAAQRAKDNDLICLTRSDVHLERGITDTLLKIDAPVFSRRVVRDADGDSYHPFVDLFAFSKQWWTEHEADLPQFVWGIDPFWNKTMVEFVKKHGGKEVSELVYRPPAKPIIYDPMPPYVSHNETLANAWFASNKVVSSVPPVYEQLPSMLVNRRALFPYGYNGSIIRHEGRLLLAYRWHSQNTLETKLALAELDDSGNVVGNSQMEIAGQSTEDPRLFHHRGQLCLSYVDSRIGSSTSFQCIIKHGPLLNDKGWKANGWQVKYGKNDWSALEKNWLFWGEGEKLFCIYTSRPEQVVLEIEGESVLAEHKSPGPRWKWGEIRGGTSPVPYDGKLLRFFHSRLDNEPPPYRWRYYVGAALMEPTPPFKTIAVSKEPILRGCEADDLSPTERFSCIHRKEMVVFPMGCIERPGGWMLSVGINDSMMALVKVGASDLKL